MALTGRRASLFGQLCSLVPTLPVSPAVQLLVVVLLLVLIGGGPGAEERERYGGGRGRWAWEEAAGTAEHGGISAGGGLAAASAGECGFCRLAGRCRLSCRWRLEGTVREMSPRCAVQLHGGERVPPLHVGWGGGRGWSARRRAC